MKLFELKCPNCGAKLKKEEGTIDIVCDYCQTEFKFDDEAHHIKYDDMEKTGYDFEKGRIKARDDAINQKMMPGTNIAAKILALVVPIFVFIIIGTTIHSIYFKNGKSIDANNYNNELEQYKGVKDEWHTENLLEDVNDKLVDDKHKLIVLYNNEDYKTVEEVSKLKDSLERGSYKITFSYDKKGYINKVIIDKVNY